MAWCRDLSCCLGDLSPRITCACHLHSEPNYTIDVAGRMRRGRCASARAGWPRCRATSPRAAAASPPPHPRSPATLALAPARLEALYWSPRIATPAAAPAHSQSRSHGTCPSAPYPALEGFGAPPLVPDPAAQSLVHTARAPAGTLTQAVRMECCRAVARAHAGGRSGSGKPAAWLPMRRRLRANAPSSRSSTLLNALKLMALPHMAVAATVPETQRQDEILARALGPNPGSKPWAHPAGARPRGAGWRWALANSPTGILGLG